ncbi:penicillin acylase family protein [Turneriella parva]|uniref:Peptidase S45 penicillin amidase n=1 Tax=Turneriella parva (strain ATCC BAA-1111 / DSM 21527 / NCTC 11395 / H) TaxID=869212 RepID=I4B582_TURPD|nr:penicillin acylase family protein [Turneriella parva]AFM12439.1 peptidase S45 penicillin amidase [Turneriella parva DSM 21527]
MALKKSSKKPTKKTATKTKAKPNKKKLLQPKAASTPIARLKQGDPTSEAELSALFEVASADNSRKAQVQLAEVEHDAGDEPRPKRKIWRYVAAVLVVSLLVGYGWLRFRLKQSLIPEEGSVTVAAISADIEIRRDAYGVPFIKAQNLDDMAFGAGFAMVADRDFQIEFLRRMAYGRLSEVLGNDTLGVDIYMRSLGFAGLAQKNYANLSPKMQKMLASYAAGVNAARAAYPKTQFEYLLLGLDRLEWKAEDSLALYQLFSFLLATNHIEEVAFLKFAAHLGLEKAAWLFPIYADAELPFEEAAQLKDVDFKKISASEPVLKAEIEKAGSLWQALTPSVPASNNWVVAPSRTKEGKSLLANDTHLQLTIPAMWYMMNLECPEYRAAGVALPGTPIVALGTNGTIAWGATMVMADNQDIFLEQLREENGTTQYLFKGKWENAIVSEEQIGLRGGKTHAFKKIKTRHGVLLNEAFLHPFPDKHLALNLRSEYGLAYRTSVGARETTLEGIFSMAAARDMKAARKALDQVTGIYLNVVYADAKNIGWVATGRYPAREGASGLLPRIGWTGENEWNGFFAPSENPSALNPKDGYIATGNDRIWNDETELWVSSSWYGSDRAGRAKELLAGSKTHTASDMAKFQADVESPTARSFAVLLQSSPFAVDVAAAIDQLPASENIRAKEALGILKDFRGDLSKESASAAVYQNFVSAMTVLTFADELGGKGSPLWENFQAINKRSYNAVQDHLLARADSPFWDNVTTPDKETKAMIFAAALAEAITQSEKQMGDNRGDWAWGKIHQYRWQHQFAKKAPVLGPYLNRGPVGTGGDLHTLNQAGNLWGDTHDVWLIPAMRFIVDFSADEPAQLMLHMGTSGNAESKHYDDMIPHFTGVTNLPLSMKPANVDAQYTKKFLLKKQ